MISAEKVRNLSNLLEATGTNGWKMLQWANLRFGTSYAALIELSEEHYQFLFGLMQKRLERLEEKEDADEQ